MWRRIGEMKQLLNIHISRKLQAILMVLGILLFSLTGAFAQTLSATVSRNPVGMNEQFELKFTLQGSGTSFRAPQLGDFTVLSGPNQSQSVQFINGSMSQSISFSYILQPKKEGTFKIEPARVEVGGKEIASNAVSITVVKGQGGSANQQGGQQNQGEKTNNGNMQVVQQCNSCELRYPETSCHDRILEPGP
jgi:hypothetical protein